MLPAIINITSGDADTFKEDYGINSIEELQSNREAFAAKLQAMFPEFQFIHLVMNKILTTSTEHEFHQ